MKDIVIAEVTKDDLDGYTASADVEQLIPAGTINIATTSDTVETYFDNTVFATVGSESATTVTIEGAALKPTMIAKITNKTVDPTTGAIIDSGEYKEKYFALGARIQMLDGTEALVWFLKGTFSTPDETGRTKDDGTDADGTTLTYNAVKTRFMFDREEPTKRVIADTTVTAVKAQQDFFKQVVTPANLATILEKKTA